MDIYKGIKFPGPLSVLGPYPMDVRSSVKNIEERDELPEEVRYPGMRVFVESTNQEFVYIDKQWKSSSPILQYTMLDNLMDLVKEMSHVINKPLSISNVIMIDLNEDDGISGSMLKDDGMLFF